MSATRPPVHGRAAEGIGRVFYAMVALIALAGQTTAAMRWLGWPLVFALPAVAALELGGIALAARADFRRRLGETAMPARLLSAAVAVFAVVFNWVGHGDPLAGGFFAGMSALGYAVWLINAGDRRRDQLRSEGKLLATPPVYGVAQWARQPWLTRRARHLAVVDPALGVHGSLVAARERVRAERRHAAIAKALRRKLSSSLDPVSADIAVHTYDLGEIARRLAEGADYDGLTALLAADLTPAHLASTERGPTATGPDPDAVLPAAAPAPSVPVEAARPARVGKRQPSAAERVARAAARAPLASAAQLAARLALSERTVQRHMRTRDDSVSTASAPPVNGADVTS